MAPTVELSARRGGCGSGYVFDGFGCRRSSGWYSWGRWVFAGIAIGLALILLLCVFIKRRNRGRGVQPMYGTGWFSGSRPQDPPQGQPADHNKYNNAHEMNNYQQPGFNQGGYQQVPAVEGYESYTSPPPYGGQPPVGNQTTGTTFNTNDGYNTGHPYGVQQPQSAYHPGGEFLPPAGPPPGK